MKDKPIQSPDSTPDALPETPRVDIEVPEKPKRRRFTAAYKLRILEVVDAAGPGEQGAILRREGLYTSHIADWRTARRDGALSGLNKKRGRKPDPNRAAQKRIAQLERQLAKTQEELRKAHLILDVQGKVSSGLHLPSTRASLAHRQTRQPTRPEAPTVIAEPPPTLCHPPRRAAAPSCSRYPAL